ncbi:nuclear pore complex component-domain-containing protein [Scheffersomyces amazonensis]|uniref:nuclear pore complex component-domain-containing protein n=1 Tax=Scheffersomyces amazonensis TaxID=1078765 RepID=UPI00315D44C6
MVPRSDYIKTPQSDDTVFEDAMNYSFAFASTKLPSQFNNSQVPANHTRLKKLPVNYLTGVTYKSDIPREEIGMQSNNTTSSIPVNVINATKNINASEDYQNTSSLDAESLRLYRIRTNFQKSIKNDQLFINKSEVQTEKTDKSEPIYYKPPSSNFKDNQYGIKSFLPPNVKIGDNSLREKGSDSSKNKIPLVFPKLLSNDSSNPDSGAVDIQKVWQSINQDSIYKKGPAYDNDELDDNDLQGNNHATGEWTNPIVKQALGRQINKEYELKKCLKFALYLIVFNLIKSLAIRFYVLYQLSQLKLKIEYQLHSSKILAIDENIYIILISRLIIGIFLINILISTVNLFRDQDQCYDLPLSENQRVLIGLKPTNEQSQLDQKLNSNFDGSTKQDIVGDREDIEAELILKQRQYELKNGQYFNNIYLPKYKKISGFNDLSSAVESNPITFDNLSSDSKNINSSNKVSTTTSQSIYPVRSLVNFDNASLIDKKVDQSQQLVKRKMSFVTATHARRSDEELQLEVNKFKKNFNLQFN